MLRHIFELYLSTEQLFQTASCNLQDLQSPSLLPDKGKGISTAVLVESAVVGLMYEGLTNVLSSSSAVKMGSSYWREAQFNYIAYAQPLCQSLDFSSSIGWYHFVKPDVLVTIPSKRDYKRNASWRCYPSCFFWTIQMNDYDGGDYGEPGEEGGEGGLDGGEFLNYGIDM